ncbi:MAG: GerMN domain-containing protein [Patescibacteria group bacterium]|nr:GerMN domain-containing protein [Patescibacteria group bacterium]
MKKIVFILLVVIVAVAGFSVGRLTAPTIQPEPALSSVKNDQTALPAVPPKDASPSSSGATDPVSAVVLETPAEGARLSLSFDAAGRARTDIGDLTVTVKDETGAVIAATRVSVIRESQSSAFGRFSQSFALPATVQGNGTVEVSYEHDGQLSPVEVRHVSFVQLDTVSIRVFFGTTADGGTDCSVVRSVERVVSSKGSIYHQALTELLKGPTDAEKNSGYFTSLPAGAGLESVTTDGSGVVTADFKPSLEKGIGGSCRVIAIRSQIIQTLKQFPEVRDVVISIDGRTEDVLQP